jgi:hypothetical protein
MASELDLELEALFARESHLNHMKRRGLIFRDCRSSSYL